MAKIRVASGRKSSKIWPAFQRVRALIWPRSFFFRSLRIDAEVDGFRCTFCPELAELVLRL